MRIERSESRFVTYTLTTAYIRVRGYGDEEKMAYTKIPEKTKDWDEPMKSEMMEFYNERFPLVECEICGKPFRKIRTAVTCSPECSHKRANAKQMEFIECDCIVCGKTFTKRRHQQKNTCSPECTKEFGKAHQGTIDRTKKKKKKDGLVELNRQAREQGLTYGQLQAKKTLAEVEKIKW